MRRFVATVAAAWLGLSVATPLSAQGASTTISGQLRSRSVVEHDLIRPGSDHFTLLRTRLLVAAEVSPHVSALVQLQDARAFGEETSTLADGSGDRIDFHQAAIRLQGDAFGRSWSGVVGRQEIVLDNERLVGAVGWSNTGRSFDAARLDLHAQGAAPSATAFAATVRERGRTDPAFDPTAASDHWLAGVLVRTGDARALVLRDVNVTAGPADDLDRTTLWLRWNGEAGSGMTVDGELAHQLGRRDQPGGSEDISAWLAAGRVALTLEESPLETVEVGADWLSGDDDPTDATYGAFNTLYATNHRYYGFMDFFLDPAARTADRGLLNGMATVRASAGGTAITGTLHRYWLAQDDPAGERALGWELDLTASGELAPGAGVLVGYGVFRAGDAALSASLGAAGSVRHWAFAQITVDFR